MRLLIPASIACISATFASAISSAMPNPSSEYCGEVGGQSKNIDRDKWGGAQLGVCRLADDSLISEGALEMHGKAGRPQQAAQAFLKSDWHAEEGAIETWARQYCEKQGGAIVPYVEHLRPGQSVSMCEFRDRSSIEAWTLLSGPRLYPVLAKKLRAD